MSDENNRQDERLFYVFLFFPVRLGIGATLVMTGPLVLMLSPYLAYTQGVTIELLFAVIWSWFATGALWLVLDYKVLPERAYGLVAFFRQALKGLFSGPLVWL